LERVPALFQSVFQACSDRQKATTWSIYLEHLGTIGAEHVGIRNMSVYLTLGEAARQVTVTKSTLHRAINDGRLSANRDDQGHYQIDPAELFRVFEPVTRNTPSNDSEQDRNPARDDTVPSMEHSGTPRNSVADDSVRWYQQQIEELQEEKAELRKDNEEKGERLSELRQAMAALPSPESVEAEKERLRREHEAQLE